MPQTPPPLGQPGPETAPHLTVTEARQGVTTGHIRWVLAISLPLATIAVATAWLVFAGAPR